MFKRDLTSKRIGEIIENNVRLIENNKIKSGDIVYCTSICEDVIFVEGPEDKFFKDYHNLKKYERYPPFPGDIIYRTIDGKVGKCGVAEIVKISSGSCFTEFKVNGKNKKSRQRVEYLEYLARSYGFKVEKNKVKKGYLLKFFGDLQEEVDDFVSLCCQNDYILW